MQDDWDRMDEARRSHRPDAHRDGAAGEVSLLSVALSHKLRLTVTALVAMIVAYAALTQVTPTYEASSQVLLEVQADPVIDIPNAVPEAPDGIATLESAIVLMRSPEILRNVVQELDLTTRVEFNSILREPSAVDRLRAMASALVDKVRLTLGAEPDPPGILRDPVERAARAVREIVSVRSIGESRVIEITAMSESGQMAAAISNAIARHYIDHQIDIKSAAGDRATAWLEERTNDARAQLEADEARLSEFGRGMIASGRAASTDLDAQLIELTTQMIQLDKQQSDLVTQRAEITQLRADGNYLSLASAADLPTITTLVEQLAALDGTIVELTAVYGDHPKTREARETREQLITLLERETALLVSGLEVRIAVLDDRRGDLAREIRTSRAALVASKEDDFGLDALTREFETSRNVYERFLLRQKEMRQRSQFQSPGARIVAEAERPSDPVAPQKSKLALLAGIAAAGAMLIYLSVRHARNTKERKVPRQTSLDLAELNRMGTLLTLHHVPEMRHPSDILRYFREHPESDLAVSVRWLQAHLKPHSRDWSSLVLVTSADRGEGKSTLAMLLAESFSRDYSTVLVNANADGWLTDFPETEEFKHAGFGFLNYSQDVLQLLNEQFAVEDRLADRRDTRLGTDIVIVDAPAMPLSDEFLEIGQQADHTVFASASNFSTLFRIRKCARALEEMGIDISAFVLRMMSRDRHAALTELPRADEPLRLTARSHR